MAFTFDSTTSGPNANSYLSVSDANDYFSGNFTGFDKWDALDNDQKERALVQAVSIIDRFYFDGIKAASTQALNWPRTGLIDRDGNSISGASIPKLVKNAACEMAYWIITEEDRVLPDTTLQQVDKFKAGPLDLQIRKNALTFPQVVLDLFDSLAEGCIISSGSVNDSQSVMFVR